MGFSTACVMLGSSFFNFSYLSSPDCNVWVFSVFVRTRKGLCSNHVLQKAFKHARPMGRVQTATTAARSTWDSKQYITSISWMRGHERRVHSQILTYMFPEYTHSAGGWKRLGAWAVLLGSLSQTRQLLLVEAIWRLGDNPVLYRYLIKTWEAFSSQHRWWAFQRHFWTCGQFWNLWTIDNIQYWNKSSQVCRGRREESCNSSKHTTNRYRKRTDSE